MKVLSVIPSYLTTRFGYGYVSVISGKISVRRAKEEILAQSYNIPVKQEKRKLKCRHIDIKQIHQTW